MKQTIRLSESQLTEVIRRTVKKALKEENIPLDQKEMDIIKQNIDETFMMIDGVKFDLHKIFDKDNEQDKYYLDLYSKARRYFMELTRGVDSKHTYNKHIDNKKLNDIRGLNY